MKQCFGNFDSLIDMNLLKSFHTFIWKELSKAIGVTNEKT